MKSHSFPAVNYVNLLLDQALTDTLSLCFVVWFRQGMSTSPPNPKNMLDVPICVSDSVDSNGLQKNSTLDRMLETALRQGPKKMLRQLVSWGVSVVFRDLQGIFVVKGSVVSLESKLHIEVDGSGGDFNRVLWGF